MSFNPCIVVPVFNHGAAASMLTEKVADFGLPAILIDDGSNEACRAELRELSQRHDWLQILAHSENRGKGAAVLSGLRAAHAQGFSHAVQIDADGQHDPSDIPRFLTSARANPTAVIAGCPIFDDSVPKGRLIARYLTHVWVWIETLSFRIRDSMCGFRVYPLSPVVRLADRTRLGARMDFDPEILVRLHWEGIRILSLPTKVTYPKDGVSHFKPWHDNCLISWMHTRLFFGMVWRVLNLQVRRFGGPAPSEDGVR